MSDDEAKAEAEAKDAVFRELRDQLTAEAMPVYEIFVAESDRGAILVASALLDETLGRLLSAHMVLPDDKQAREARKELLGKRGALGTFGARIQACFLFGWIDKERYEVMERIRRIRNLCAHDIKHVSFGTSQVRDLVAALPDVPPGMEPPADMELTSNQLARVRFLIAAAWAYVVVRSAVARELVRAESDARLAKYDAEIKRLEAEIDAGREELAREMGISRAEVDARIEALLASGRFDHVEGEGEPGDE